MSIRLTILIIIFLFTPFTTLAFDWGECPFGNVDDPYPGLCGRYRDLDEDGFCDLSQTKPEARGTTAVAATEKPFDDKYNVIFITVITLLVYGLGRYLVYINKYDSSPRWQLFTEKNVRWFWNVILLWSFLVIIISSVVNLMQLYGWLGATEINYSFWHIEAGLVMLIVAILHFLKRWKHFIK